MTRVSAVSPSALRTIRWALVIAAALQFWKHGIAWPLSMHGVDFTVLWRSAVAVLEGHSVYVEPAQLPGPPDHWEVFKYPQFLAIVFCWLGKIPWRTAEIVWKLLMAACVVGCLPIMAALGRHMAGKHYPTKQLDSPRGFVLENWTYLCAVLLAAFTPATSAIAVGQVGPLLLLATLAFIYCSITDHEIPAGISWAILCLVKLTPVLLVVPILLWRKWRTLGAGIAVLGTYVVALALVGRVPDEWYYVRHVAPQIPYLCSRISISYVQWFVSSFVPAALTEPATYTRIASITSTILGSLYLLCMVAHWRLKAPYARTLAAALVGIAVVSPVLEFHHFVSVFPALLLQFSEWIRGRIGSLLFVVVAIAWVPLFGAGYFVTFNAGLRAQFIPTAAVTLLFIMHVFSLVFVTSDSKLAE